MNRIMITLFALGTLLLAGCEEWGGASSAKPRTQGEVESEATMQTPSAIVEEPR
ncbi:MAG: hypothetical protein M3436_11040 [Pseudomonadota bacterium]|nr:hypothetical protein [Pseudomonadota bacterium]